MKKTDFYLNVIKLGAILIVFVTPFLSGLPLAYPTISSKVFFLRIVVEIIFVFYILLTLSDRRYRPRLSLISKSVIIFFVILVLSAFLGVNLYRSFWGNLERMEGFVTLLHLVVFFFVLTFTFDGPGFWLTLFKISLIASFFISLYTIIAGQINCGQIHCDESLATFFGNGSFLAFSLLFNVFFALFFFFQEKNKWLRFFYFAVLILDSWVIFTSGNMGAMAGCLAGFLFFIFFYFAFSLIPKKKKYLILGLILILIIFSLFLALTIKNKIKDQSWVQKIPFLEKLTNISLKSPSIRDRLLVWRASLEAWRERFWLGWGWENYKIAYQKHYTPEMSFYIPLSFDRVHNKILDVGVMSGILGLLSYLFIFFASFYVLFKMSLQKKIDFGIATAIAAVLVAYFVNNLFLFDTINSYILFFLIVGFIGALSKSESEEQEDDIKRTPSKNIVTSKVFYGLVFILIILTILFSYHANIKPIFAAHYGFLGYYWQATDYQKSLNNFKKSLSFTTYGDKELRNRIAILVTNMRQVGPIPKNKVEDLKYAVEELKKNIGESPDLTDFESYLLLGKAYNLLGNTDKSYYRLAEEAFKGALKINRFRIDTYRFLVDTKILQNDLKGALAYFSQAKELFKESNLEISEFYQYSGKLYLMMDDNEKALVELEKFIKIEKNLGRVEWEYFTSLFYFYEEKLRDDTESALSFYSFIEDLNLKLPNLRWSLGKLYLRIGEREKALIEFEKGIEIENEIGRPHLPEFLVFLFELYDEKRDFQKIIPLAEKSIDYFKTLPLGSIRYENYLNLYKFLSNAYKELGETEKSENVLSELLKIDPDFYNELKESLNI